MDLEFDYLLPCSRVDPRFDLKRVDYDSLDRFVGLLIPDTLHHFSRSSKANYARCMQLHGKQLKVDVLHGHRYTPETVNAGHGLSLICSRTADYTRFQQTHAKVLPFLRMSTLNVWSCVCGLRRNKVDVPPQYHTLAAFDLEDVPQTDFVLDSYYHSGVSTMEVVIVQSDPLKIPQLINRIFQKTAPTREYYFLLLAGCSLDVLTDSLQPNQNAESIKLESMEGGRPGRSYNFETQSWIPLSRWVSFEPSK